jgi:hypothetical protein
MALIACWSAIGIVATTAANSAPVTYLRRMKADSSKRETSRGIATINREYLFFE